MNKPRPPKLGEQGTKGTKLDKTAAELVRLLEPLEREAIFTGDAQAAELVVSLAARLCGVTLHMACFHQKLADEIARGRTSWPILCANHPDVLKRNLRWLKVLPLGEKTGWNKVNPRKPYSMNTVANSTVSARINSILLMRAVEGKGPHDPVSFDMVWENICRQGPPESVPYLREIGLSFAEAKRDICPRGSRSYESNLRAGIKRRLRVAFSDLVKS